MKKATLVSGGLLTTRDTVALVGVATGFEKSFATRLAHASNGEQLARVGQAAARAANSADDQRHAAQVTATERVRLTLRVQPAGVAAELHLIGSFHELTSCIHA